MSNATSLHGKDLYKILRVSHTATVSEIKLAYYQIAQQLHPDKHNGCATKLESFKQVNEAYSILSDTSKRHAYDFAQGYSYNRNRRTAPPKDYRKVYMARPPPHWKTVWDHAKHYDMHYGTGMQQEAIRQAMKTAERDGSLDYTSPLGRGFTFDHVGHQQDDTLHGATYNPYSKKVQGPPKVVFEYSEGDNLSGREQVRRHERIVRDMHSRRDERKTRHDNGTSRHAQSVYRSSPYHDALGTPNVHTSRPPASSTTASWPYSQYQNESTTRGTKSSAEKESCTIM